MRMKSTKNQIESTFTKPSEDRDVALIRKIVELLNDKKGEDIQILDLSNVNPYFHYFLLVSANSSVHLRTLVRELSKQFAAFMPERKSGFRTEDIESGWVVVDFIDVVVHLFQKEQRQFYNLERLWGDAVVLSVEDLPKA